MLVPPCRYAGGELRTFWHSDYFRSAEGIPGVPAFTPDERALLDTYDAIAADPDDFARDLHCRVFRRGDE